MLIFRQEGKDLFYANYNRLWDMRVCMGGGIGEVMMGLEKVGIDAIRQKSC